VEQLGTYYGPLAERTEALWAQFTEKELRSILVFTRRSTAVAAEEATRIRTMTARPRPALPPETESSARVAASKKPRR